VYAVGFTEMSKASGVCVGGMGLNGGTGFRYYLVNGSGYYRVKRLKQHSSKKR